MAVGAYPTAVNPVTGELTYGDLPATGSWLPEDSGVISWTSDPALSLGTTLAVNGTLYLSALRLRRPATITNIHWIASTAGASPVAGQNFAGLVSSAGLVLASVNVDSKVTAANSAQSVALATPQAVSSGLLWVALLFNAATPPSLLRMAGSFTATNNFNLATAGLRFASNGAGLTALPASITPASNAGAAPWWVAVS